MQDKVPQFPLSKMTAFPNLGNSRFEYLGLGIVKKERDGKGRGKKACLPSAGEEGEG